MPLTKVHRVGDPVVARCFQCEKEIMVDIPEGIASVVVICPRCEIELRVFRFRWPWGVETPKG